MKSTGANLAAFKIISPPWLKLPARRAALAAGLCLAIAGGGLTACAPVIDYHGYLPRSDDIRKVRVGQSKAEIQAILGSPSTTATIENDSDSYYYISSVQEKFAFFAPKTIDREILAVRFSPDGRVAHFAHYGLEDGRIIDFISRKTPTRGKELTVLQQLFENLGRFGPGTG